MERIYCDLMLLASGVIAALAVAIICVKIPSRPEFGKLKTARATLAASFITLSILNFICYFTGYDVTLDRLNTLIVAAFQALLLTGTLLVFIRPDVVTGKWVGLSRKTDHAPSFVPQPQNRCCCNHAHSCNP